MITKVLIPKISANIEEVTITAWFKKEGDSIKKGESLLEITTDKACIEVESPKSGIVRKILARKKSVLPVGYVITLIGAVTDKLPDVSRKNTTLLEKHRNRINKSDKPQRKSIKKKTSDLRATPGARRLAKELKIDLNTLKSKAQTGIITRSMVEQAGNLNK